MTGVEFLDESIERFPNAQRVLLAACSDTEAAIREINEVSLDSKPDGARFALRLPESNRENGG